MHKSQIKIIFLRQAQGNSRDVHEKYPLSQILIMKQMTSKKKMLHF